MNALGRLLRARDRRAESGAVMVEFLIAYLPVLTAFLMFWQLGEVLVAQMIVERASSAAGRAAIVVLPDDPAFYEAQDKGRYDGSRKREIRLAAGMILAASPHLSENFAVDVADIPAGDDTVGELTVKVEAEFRCKRLTWVCGADGLTTLTASSQHTYHGAGYDYEPTDLSNIGQGNSSTASDPGCSDVGTGGAGSQGGGKGGSGNGSGGVPGKGSGGRSGNGGSGGNSPDQSGSCPPGQTANKDGTCSSSRGSPGRCRDGSTSNPDGLCSDGTCANTKKKPKPGYDKNDPCPDDDANCIKPVPYSLGGAHQLTASVQVDGYTLDVSTSSGFASCESASCKVTQPGGEVNEFELNVAAAMHKRAFNELCNKASFGCTAKDHTGGMSAAESNFWSQLGTWCSSGGGNASASSLGNNGLSAADQSLISAFNAAAGSGATASCASLNFLVKSASQAGHTEFKAFSALVDFGIPGGLENSLRGKTITMSGQLSPCAKCEAFIKKLTSELGVTVRYTWTKGFGASSSADLRGAVNFPGGKTLQGSGTVTYPPGGGDPSTLGLRKYCSSGSP